MKWIKVTDELPKINKAIMAYSRPHIYSAYYSIQMGREAEFYDNVNSSLLYDITHWTELPEKPNEMEKI